LPDVADLATYSNSDSTVLTHVSIFEKMWMHEYSKETRQNQKTLPLPPIAFTKGKVALDAIDEEEEPIL
jgi:hypothetical protein